MVIESRLNLLLVEDEAIIAFSKKQNIEKYGYHVMIANSGEKAIDIVGQNKNIDLILMDIDLGAGIDGTEAAKLILKKREIPVIFMSSHVESEIIKKTEKITSYGYVVKNSSGTVLNASIKMAFKLYEANKMVVKERDNLNSILESMETGVFIVNQNFDIQYANHAMMKDFGAYSGRKCYDYFNDRIEVCPWCKGPEVFAGKTVRWEWTSLRNHKLYDITDTPFRNSDGSISKLEIFQDMTGKK